MHLSSSLTADRLLIVVSDDGEGTEPGRLSESKGLGLKAVTRQLHAHFPGEAEMTVETERQRGFTVTLRMPARLPEDHRHAHNIGRR